MQEQHSQSKSSKKKLVLIVGAGFAFAILCLVLVLTWYFTGPARTLTTIRESIRNGDKSGLESSIDYDSVRKSVKAQVLAASLKSDNPFGVLAAGFANNLIETMLTPEGMIALAKSQKAEGEAPFDFRALEGGRFVSASEYHLTRNGTTVVMTFKGTGWKVTDIQLNENALNNKSR